MFLIRTLQTPSTWHIAAVLLNSTINGNGAGILRTLQTNPLSDLQRQAVSCNDNRPFTPAPIPDIIDELLSVYQNVSRSVFSVVTTEPDSGCNNWPVTPPERFEGPWNHTLRNPILVFSNIVSGDDYYQPEIFEAGEVHTVYWPYAPLVMAWSNLRKHVTDIDFYSIFQADPVTPLDSGKKVVERLGDSSRLVVQNGPGVSLSSVSTHPKLITGTHVLYCRSEPFCLITTFPARLHNVALFVGDAFVMFGRRPESVLCKRYSPANWDGVRNRFSTLLWC